MQSRVWHRLARCAVQATVVQDHIRSTMVGAAGHVADMCRHTLAPRDSDDVSQHRCGARRHLGVREPPRRSTQRLRQPIWPITLRRREICRQGVLQDTGHERAIACRPRPARGQYREDVYHRLEEGMALATGEEELAIGQDHVRKCLAAHQGQQSRPPARDRTPDDLQHGNPWAKRPRLHQSRERPHLCEVLLGNPGRQRRLRALILRFKDFSGRRRRLRAFFLRC